MYKCIKCSYNTEKKSNFTKHLSTKKHILCCGSPTRLNEIQRDSTRLNETQRDSRTRKKKHIVENKDYQDILEELSKGNSSNIYNCRYCNLDIENKLCYRRHIRDICLLVPNELKILLKYKQETNKNFKGKQIVSLDPKLHPSNILNNNTNTIYNININNNISNNINNNNQNIIYNPEIHNKINPLFYESTEHFTDEDKLEIIHSKPDHYDSYLDKLYKNTNNNNAMITSKREKIIKYIDKRGNIKSTDCNKIISRLVNINMDKLESIAEDMKDKVHPSVLKKFNKLVDNYYNNDTETCKNLDKQTYIKLIDISNTSKDIIDNCLKIKDETGREHIIVEVMAI